MTSLLFAKHTFYLIKHNKIKWVNNTTVTWTVFIITRVGSRQCAASPQSLSNIAHFNHVKKRKCGIFMTAQQTGHSLTPLSNNFYLHSTESHPKASRSTLHDQKKTNWVLQSKNGATVARKNSPVGRNQEQIWNPEGSHLFWLVGVKRKYNKWRGRNEMYQSWLFCVISLWWKG